MHFVVRRWLTLPLSDLGEDVGAFGVQMVQGVGENVVVALNGSDLITKGKRFAAAAEEKEATWPAHQQLLLQKCGHAIVVGQTQKKLLL